MSASIKIQRDRLIRLPVRIADKFPSRPVMVVDTGSSMTMITPRVATEIGLDLKGNEAQMQLVGVAGSAWAVKVILKRESFMGMNVENLTALCHPLPSHLGLDGILGLNFLKHFNLAIDHDTETISATPAEWSA